MPFAFSVGDIVNVAGLETDTGIVDGVPATSLVNPGEVLEALEYPPGVEPNGNPSPHYRVQISDGGGTPHEVLFTEPRLSAV